MDRYNHDLGEDTDDTDDSPLFGSFSSYSPQSRKISQTRLPLFNTSEPELDFSRKQLFRGESDASDAQLSPGFANPTSIAVKTIQKNILTDRVVQPVATKNSSFYDPAEKTEKSDDTNAATTSATTSTTFVPRDTSIANRKNNSGDALSVSLSTPDSSQTESDDVSPQIQRKRHSHTRDKLPRFSISIDDEHM